MTKLQRYISKEVSNAPLIVFRILFGALLLFSTVRFFTKGWIAEMYIDPVYHFSFISWLQPLPGDGMYLVFALLALSAAGIMLGLFYRASTVLFLILFTYVELLDKTYYLNHYYLVTILTFWLAVVPANRRFSLDALLFPGIRSGHCTNWHILIFKVQLSIVYFFAGLAKVNPDWLLKAQPLATWLPGRYDMPVLGQWFHLKEVAFAFSWAGCLYDLLIWVFLWIRKTRNIAYVFVLAFHILTGLLFPRIGMFPYIMIISTIIFFDEKWHEKVLSFFSKDLDSKPVSRSSSQLSGVSKLTTGLLVAYVLVQLYLPVRHLAFPGNLFWHEQGYRFSWRVMLMEKNGATAIIVRDPVTGKQKEVDQDEYLTPFQRQQMRSQPDMLLQFGKYIGDLYSAQSGYEPEIYIKSRLSLNGRRSRQYTDDSLDIYKTDNPMARQWILPFK